MISPKIKKLIDELEKIENNIISKLNKLEPNKNLNDRLIEMMAEYPNEKHIIKSLIKLNDNLSTLQTNSVDIILDILTDMIEHKKRVLELIEEIHQPKLKTKKINLKEIPLGAWTTITFSILGILIFLFLLIHPEKTDVISKTAIELKQKGK